MTGIPRPIAATLGFAAQCSDAMGEFAAELTRAAAVRALVATERASLVYRRAADRGERMIAQMPLSVDKTLGETADGALSWVERNLVRRVAEDMKPYLSDSLVPELIDAVTPHVRSVVIPVIVEDLSHDERLRAMVEQQSRGLATEAVESLRLASAAADDRIETSVRHPFHRRADG